MAHYLLVIALQLFLSFVVSQGTDCKEENILRNLYTSKPEYKRKIDSYTIKPGTPRTLLQALEKCTVYYGNIDIKENSTVDLGFDEYVRQGDLSNLKNLRVIYGYVNLDLKKYPGIKSLSFLSSLRMIQSNVSKRGLILFHSEVESIGLSNLRLKVRRVGISENYLLCYLENFRSINSSIDFQISYNKDPESCKIEGKVCSKLCLSGTGCWGPKDYQCFRCRWIAGNDCTSNCESKKAFFTPPTGRVCGRCHTSCKYGCFGPALHQCHPRPAPSDICPKYQFFDDASKQCKECSKNCVGDSFEKRHRLIVRACTGPESAAGPRGCSVKCHGSSFLTISSTGQLQCSPCHEDCSSCWSGSPSACLQLRQSKNENQGNTNNAALIGGGIALCFVTILLGVGLTFAILAARKKLRIRRRRKVVLRHLRSRGGDSPQLPSMLRTLMQLGSRGDSDEENSPDEESGQPTDVTSNLPSEYIFISYQQENIDVVKDIRAHLQENGISCRMHEENARAEDTDLSSSKVVLACVTPEFVASEDRKAEIKRADECSGDLKSPVAAIFFLVLGDVEWPPSDEEVPMNRILAKTESFRMRTEEVGAWNSDTAQDLMKQLRTHVGVKLLVMYDNDLFTVVSGRPEVESKKENPNPTKFSQMRCHIPGIAAGWCSFKDLRKVLSVLFNGAKIRSIGQLHGTFNERNVAQATSRDEDKVATMTYHSPYCDIAGKECSYKEADLPPGLQKIRGEDRLFLCGGGRRTVLHIHPM